MKTGGRLARLWQGQLPLVLAMVAAAALLFVSETGFRRTEAALANRERLLDKERQVARLQRLVIAAESSHRGWLLTGRDAYREPYLEVLPQLDAQLRSVEALYRGDRETAADVARLAEMVRRKTAEMQTTAQLYQNRKDDNWRDLVLTDIGRETMVEIENAARRIGQVEAGRVEAARRVVEETLLASRIAIGAMVVFGLLVLLALLANARRLTEERARRLEQVRGERDRLEAEVERRTAEIVELARHLERASEDERARLSRELHDELGGLLTAAKLDVARLRSRLPASSPEAGERIAHLVQTLDAGIALKRRIIEDLRPSSLSHLGLRPALEILCGEFAERSQIEVATALDEVELDDAVELTLYRLVQEALTNVAKYAQAKRVEVSLAAGDDAVEVRVRDDGCGFDPSAVRPGRHGLAGMRFRVQSARGSLDVDSAPGAGTTLRARVPR